MRDERRPWPEDEPPPTPEELEQARSLGERLDRALDGEPTAAASADDPIVAALMLRASAREESLGPARRDALVGEALAAARPAASAGLLRRLAPALAVAASLLLVAAALLTMLAPMSRRADRAPGQAATAAELPAQLRSRPSNDLLGRPIEDRAGASRRLDLVFADRLAGYRQLQLGEGGWR